jgi:hypothetical protein
MHLTLEVDREEDGRWIAEVPDLKGVLAYVPRRLALSMIIGGRALAHCTGVLVHD